MTVLRRCFRAVLRAVRVMVASGEATLAKAGVTVDVKMGSKDSYWSDILDNGTLCCYRSGAMPMPVSVM